MQTITLKVSEALQRDLDRASRQQRISRSELVRRAVRQYVSQTQESDGFVSALHLAGDLAGSIRKAPVDLSTHPRHMEGYGE